MYSQERAKTAYYANLEASMLGDQIHQNLNMHNNPASFAMSSLGHAIIPRPLDIILERDMTNPYHRSNGVFKKVVDDMFPEFYACTDDRGKMAVAKKAALRLIGQGVRFLQTDRDNNDFVFVKDELKINALMFSIFRNRSVSGQVLLIDPPAAAPLSGPAILQGGSGKRKRAGKWHENYLPSHHNMPGGKGSVVLDMTQDDDDEEDAERPVYSQLTALRGLQQANGRGQIKGGILMDAHQATGQRTEQTSSSIATGRERSNVDYLDDHAMTYATIMAAASRMPPPAPVTAAHTVTAARAVATSESLRRLQEQSLEELARIRRRASSVANHPTQDVLANITESSDLTEMDVNNHFGPVDVSLLPQKARQDMSGWQFHPIKLSHDLKDLPLLNEWTVVVVPVNCEGEPFTIDPSHLSLG